MGKKRKDKGTAHPGYADPAEMIGAGLGILAREGRVPQEIAERIGVMVSHLQAGSSLGAALALCEATTAFVDQLELKGTKLWAFGNILGQLNMGPDAPVVLVMQIAGRKEVLRRSLFESLTDFGNWERVMSDVAGIVKAAWPDHGTVAPETLAAPIDAPDPHGLTGLVRFVRCEGGRLEVAETQGGATLRLLPPREWFREDLAALVQGAGHVGLLVRLLSLAAEGLAPTGPATAPVGLSALAAV